MECKKCGGKIVNNVCIKCGYFINGEQIEEKNIDKFKELKLFNEDFYIINNNKKQYIPFLIGPIYISYRGHILTGTILGILDCLLFYLIVINNVFMLFSNTILIYIAILINRIFWASFSNSICLILDKIKIKQIKSKYKDNYIYKLKTYKHHKIYALITLLIYVMLIVIYIIITGKLSK